MSNKSVSTSSSFCFFFILFLCSCQNNEAGPWQKYYLSPRLSNESLVYHYSGKIDGKPTERFVVHKKNGDTLKHIYINSKGIIDQVILEEMFPDGVQVLSYNLSAGDQTIDASIQENNIFCFIPLNTKQYLTSAFKWHNPVDSSQNNVIKIRRFLKDTTIDFNGQMNPAIIFETHEEITNTKGNTFTYTSRGREIYLENVGLFRELKHIESAYRLNFELKNILSPHEVEFNNE